MPSGGQCLPTLSTDTMEVCAGLTVDMYVVSSDQRLGTELVGDVNTHVCLCEKL